MNSFQYIISSKKKENIYVIFLLKNIPFCNHIKENVMMSTTLFLSSFISFFLLAKVVNSKCDNFKAL